MKTRKEEEEIRKKVELYVTEFFRLNPLSEWKPDILKLISDENMLFKLYLNDFNSFEAMHKLELSFPYLHARCLQVSNFIKDQKLFYNKHPEEYGFTLLMQCVSCVAPATQDTRVYFERYKVNARQLLQRGVDANDKDIYNRTALFYPAIAQEFIEDAYRRDEFCKDFVNILLEYGADPTIKDKYGKTALDYYQMYARADSSVISLLKQEMAKPKWNQPAEKPLFRMFDGSTYKVQTDALLLKKPEKK